MNVRRRTSGNLQERQKMKEMQGRTAYMTDAKNRMQVKEENKKESKGPREIKEAVFDKLLEQWV